MGRLIRHRKDYGAIVLCEERWAQNNGQPTNGLSSWLRSKVQFNVDLSKMCSSIKTIITSNSEQNTITQECDKESSNDDFEFNDIVMDEFLKEDKQSSKEKQSIGDKKSK